MKLVFLSLFIALLVLLPLSIVNAAPAKRIIALSPHSVEILYSIGAGESIMATTEHADYPDVALDIPRIGGYHGIQIERVIELNPDLVVVWGSGNKAQDIARIEELGFNTFNSDPKTLEEVATVVTALGELTGRQREADLIASDYLKKLSNLRQSNADKPEVTVFYQLWSTPLMTASKNSWIQQIITVCHGKNIYFDAASDYPQVSLESVVLKMPQVILQTKNRGNTSGLDWSQWSEIPAVQNNHIYQLNADLLHRAAPRAILGIEALCNALDRVRSE